MLLFEGRWIGRSFLNYPTSIKHEHITQFRPQSSLPMPNIVVAKSISNIHKITSICPLEMGLYRSSHHLNTWVPTTADHSIFFVVSNRHPPLHSQPIMKKGITNWYMCLSSILEALALLEWAPRLYKKCRRLNINPNH